MEEGVEPSRGPSRPADGRPDRRGCSSMRASRSGGCETSRVRPVCPVRPAGAEQIPDLSRYWKSARVGLVRTYDWVSRLDTVDNPDSLFPRWSADPDDPGQLQLRRYRLMGQAGPGDRRGDHLHPRERCSVQQASCPRSGQVRASRGEHRPTLCLRVGWWRVRRRRDALGVRGPARFRHIALRGNAGRILRDVRRRSASGEAGQSSAAVRWTLHRRSRSTRGPTARGFSTSSSRDELPLDFFTWMWFTDDSRDPLDFRTVGSGTSQCPGRPWIREPPSSSCAYWNMTGIPNAQFADADAAAFQAAAAVYMQDFRDRPGHPLPGRHRNRPALQDHSTLPASSRPMAARTPRTGSFRLVGQTLAARERLSVSGGDENGFAVLAGRTEADDIVRILIANYAIPDAVSGRRATVTSSSSRCRSVPSGRTCRCLRSPRRTHAKSARLAVTTRSKSSTFRGETTPAQLCDTEPTVAHEGEIVGSPTGYGNAVSITGRLTAPAVELIEISPIRE